MKRLKSLSKVILTIALMAVSIFVFQSSTNALAIPEGVEQVIATGYFAPDASGSLNTYTYDGKTYPYCVFGKNDTLCVYFGVAMQTNQLYNVDYRIEMTGKEAVVYRRNTNEVIRKTENDANAMLLASLVMPDTGSVQGSYYSQKQYSVWAQFPNFNKVNSLGIVCSGIVGGNDGGSTQRGKQYLQELSQDHTPTITNKTDIENIKIESIQDGDNQLVKVGPYKYDFNGSITNVIVNNQEDKQIEYEIGYYEGNQFVTTTDVNKIKSGQDFYIIVSGNGENSSIKVKLQNKVTYRDLSATVWVIEKDNGKANQNLITITYDDKEKENEGESEFTQTDLFTDIHIDKVNTDNVDFKLPNVHFIIKNNITGKYITLEDAPQGLSSNKNGDTVYKVDYVDSEQDAYEFITNDEGKIDVYDVIIGQYKFIELLNENYGYEENPEFDPITLTSDKEEIHQLSNKQILVKLSGYVWEDVATGKDSTRNDLYNDNDYDDSDVLMNQIPVRLIDRTTGEIIQETLTGPDNFADGHYLFEDVLIEKLEDYYIEFEYDGLVYQNVVPHIDVANGSKAAEGENTRDEFNERFGVVCHKDEEDLMANKGYTQGIDGQEGIDELNYTWEFSEDELTRSVLNPEDNYIPILATTDETGYLIRNNFTYGMEEIQNINLGVYKRAQPDLDLYKTLESAKLTINNYENLYIYSNRKENLELEANAMNVGVRFKNPYNSRYTQPIYHADAVREIEDTGKELHAYVTYAICVYNSSTMLTNTVQEVVDYFDTRYMATPIVVGTSYNEETGEITDNVDYELSDYNDKYRKMLIYADLSDIGPGEVKKVYVTLSIDRQGIYDICNLNTNASEDNKVLLDNIAEINTYSTFFDGKIYAGIDKDSAPGNAIPGDEKTYEDDTAIAPAYQLEFRDIGGGRSVKGKVFEDYADSTTNGAPGVMLLGNGVCDTDEPGIAGVKVQMEVFDQDTGDWKIAILNDQTQGNLDNEVEAVTYTDANGEFEFVGFVPDEYRVVYIWGDQEYVGNQVGDDGNKLYTKYTPYYFKSTITPMWQQWEANNRYNWYLQDVETKYNDARDLETKIDELSQLMNGVSFVYGNTADYKNNIPPFEMTSATLSFKAGIEEGDDNTNYTFTTVSDGNEFKLPDYIIQNVDFGIIEKGKTKLDVTKKIDTFKVTLSNGTVFAQGKITEDGKIEGDSDYVIYNPTQQGSNILGSLVIQMDQELMLGSTLEITYKFNVVNDSSLTYDTLEYYYYGTQGSEEDILKLSAGMLIDYLGDKWSFDSEKYEYNKQWQQISKQDLIDMKYDGKYDYISDEVKNSGELDEVKILLNTSLANTYLKPLENVGTYLSVNSLLTQNTSVEYKNAVNIGQIDINRETSTNTSGTNEQNNIALTSTTAAYAPPVAEPGDYVMDQSFNVEGDVGYTAERATIIPPTGSGFNAIPWIVLTIVSLTVLGTGIVVIAKVSKKND